MDTAKILIVDDEKNILLSIERALSIYNYNIDLAVCGKDALNAIRHGDYDVIILDLRLPDMDGMEILRSLDSQEIRKKVIMITAHGSIDCAVEAMKLGCVDFIPKPFELDTIRKAVENLLSRGQLSEKQSLEFDTLFQQAKLQTQQKQYSKAMLTLKEALTIKPDNAAAYNYMGALFEILGKIQEAITAYQTSVMLDPNCESAKQNLERIRNAGLMDHIILG